MEAKDDDNSYLSRIVLVEKIALVRRGLEKMRRIIVAQW